MDFDSHLDREVERHLEEQELSIPTCSICGNAAIEECCENSEIITLGEYQYQKYEEAECDRTDSERELRNET